MKDIYPYFIYIGVVCILAFTQLFDPHFTFIALTVLLVLYNLAELSWLYKTNRNYFFINPILLAFIANFLAYNGGLSNLLLLKDGIYTLDHLAAPLIEERYWLNYTMGYTCLAAIFMWWGYKVALGRKISDIVLHGFKYKRFLGSNIRFGLVIALAVFGYLLKLYLIKIGLFGRIVDDTASTVSAQTSFLYSQTRFLRSFSTLPFLFICLMYFREKTYKLKVLFITVLVLEFSFAALSGARGPIIITTFLILLSYYFSTQKIKLSMFLYVGVAFGLAFTVIMEYKDFVIAEKPIGQSPIELISSFQNYRENMSKAQVNRVYGAVLENFAQRINFVDEAAMAIRYKAKFGLKASDPDFIRPLLTIPLDVVVPKFIQKSPNVSWGLWFKVNVYRQTSDLIYNIAFSAVGYLYIAGGPILIFIGFFVYGVVLKSVYRFLDYGILGFLTYMLLLSSVIVYKTGVAPVYVGYLRIILLAPVFLGLFFKRIKPS